MKRKKLIKKKRMYYASDEDEAKILALAERMDMPKSRCVKRCMLAISETPILEYVMKHGVLLNTCAESFLYYLTMIEVVDKVIDQLKRQGIEIELDNSNIDISGIKKFREECTEIIMKQMEQNQ